MENMIRKIGTFYIVGSSTIFTIGLLAFVYGAIIEKISTAEPFYLQINLFLKILFFVLSVFIFILEIVYVSTKKSEQKSAIEEK